MHVTETRSVRLSMRVLDRPACSLKYVLREVVVVVLTSGDVVAHGRKKLVSSSDGEPCQKMTVYYHDILYDVTNTANATSAVAAQPTLLSRSVSVNDSYFGEVVVFNDVVTAGRALARAEGFYFYDKESPSAWFAFSLVFNSTAHRGTINLMGADIIAEKTRDISVVGGTGDFFISHGIATLRTDTFEGLYYFRLQMDIKLYECYV
ncbi:dirigent protein 5-like [Miscanthus floridulus]|uniref:dirigent protein 5-like n=1 Tax=Miscanthus floridulus TaxID=154761 RepID=UPI00345905E7